MLIKFFRSSYLVHYFVLFILTLILWGGAIIHPVDVIPSSDIFPFYSIIYYWLGGNKILFSIFGLILLFFEAILINNIVTENDIVNRSSLLPGFLYVLLMSFLPELQTLHPVLIANFFLIILLNIIYKLFGQKGPLKQLYNLGLILGIASFFYFPVYIFIFYILIALFVLRTLSGSELVVPFVGLITPYIFLVVWYFVFDQLDFVCDAYLDFFKSISIIKLEFDVVCIIISAIIIILFILSMLYYASGKYYEKIISTRKKIKLSFLFLITSFVLLILYGGSMKYSIVVVVAIPLTIFISSYFSELKKIFILNILVVLLILLMIINNYHLLDLLSFWG